MYRHVLEWREISVFSRLFGNLPPFGSTVVHYVISGEGKSGDDPISQGHEAFQGLPGHLGDDLEVLVDVEDDQPVGLGGRCNQQIGQ